MTPALLELATEVALAAGVVLLEHRERVLSVQTKTSATDPVSEADRASERLIVDRLLAARPDDTILGEEDAGNRTGTSGVRWVIDPLDGTVNYLYGIPQWCVSIAAEDEHGARVGVVHAPAAGETFTAGRGRGAWLGERPLEVRDPDGLGATLVATGFAYDPAVRASQGAFVRDLLGTVRDIRRAGAAALDLAWLAAGRLDAYFECGLQPWDWAAGDLLVREASGSVSRGRMRLGGSWRDGLLAGGPNTHERLRAWLADRDDVRW